MTRGGCVTREPHSSCKLQVIFNRRQFEWKKLSSASAPVYWVKMSAMTADISWIRFLRILWGKYVEYVPVCPEVECGLGVPRKSMRLEGNPDFPLLITTHTKQDMTKLMLNWAHKRVAQLEKEDICGFIFKSDSPSCGMERVKIYNEPSMPVKAGRGIFAGIFMEHFPLLPVQDEESLHDSGLRENFIERIFAFFLDNPSFNSLITIITIVIVVITSGD